MKTKSIQQLAKQYKVDLNEKEKEEFIERNKNVTRYWAMGVFFLFYSKFLMHVVDQKDPAKATIHSTIQGMYNARRLLRTLP